MDIVQDNTTLRKSMSFPKNTSENDARFSRGNLWNIRVRDITVNEEECTLIVALMLWNPCGAMVYTEGRSTSLRSPRVAKSKQRFWRVLGVWLTNRTSACDMKEYEHRIRTRGSYRVKCRIRAFWRTPRHIWDPRILTWMWTNILMHRKTIDAPVSWDILLRFEIKSSCTSLAPVALPRSSAY